MKRVRRLLTVAVLTFVVAGCTDDSPGSGPTSGAREPTTIRVPADHDTIQAAVDAAEPGDMVLISEGVYAEQVTIETDGLTVRGVDRNGTVLDGGGTLENGVMVLADGVAVENLTTRNYRSNGVLFTGDYGSGRTLRGYRVAYVTAADNGLYGIYAFNARGGLIEQSYASGHPDSGFYIGQCNPCDALIRNVIAEFNAVGYQGTNAGGNLVITSSVWARNRVGLQPNSSVKERLAPQTDSVIVGNLILDNSEARSPRATDAFGVGIAVGGGSSNQMIANRIEGHVGAGVVVTDQDGFVAADNRVEDNDLSGNALDLAVVGAGSPRGNCFTGNRFTTSTPADIERRYTCAPGSLGGTGTLALVPGPPQVDPKAVPPPPAQPTMADPQRRPKAPASATAPTVDVASVSSPDRP